MRTTLFALVAAVAFAGVAPAFADTMQRDGDHSGRLGDPQVATPLPYGQVYTGRSVTVDRDANRYESLRALDREQH